MSSETYAVAKDTTVVYYTGNQERLNFERRVKVQLLNVISDMPLISVSHKPIDFGENICVGPMEISGRSAIKQLQIGAKAAKTRFVVTAESDCVYPREHFTIQATKDDIFYLSVPLWVLFCQGGGYHGFYQRKIRGGELFAMHVNRELLISRIDYILGEWDNPTWHLENPRRSPCVIHKLSVEREFITLDKPIVTFKTNQNMHRRTISLQSSQTTEIPYWGTAQHMIEQYVGVGPQ